MASGSLISLDSMVSLVWKAHKAANIALKWIEASPHRSVHHLCGSAKRASTASTWRSGTIRGRMSVQEYIDKHELTKVVEDAVNAAVKVKPDEPLSFLVRAAPAFIDRRWSISVHASLPAAGGGASEMPHARSEASRQQVALYCAGSESARCLP